MLKRLYKRFLEWALAPVLDDVRMSVATLRCEVNASSMRVCVLEAGAADVAATVANTAAAVNSARFSN